MYGISTIYVYRVECIVLQATRGHVFGQVVHTHADINAVLLFNTHGHKRIMYWEQKQTVIIYLTHMLTQLSSLIIWVANPPPPLLAEAM